MNDKLKYSIEVLEHLSTKMSVLSKKSVKFKNSDREVVLIDPKSLERASKLLDVIVVILKNDKNMGA